MDVTPQELRSSEIKDSWRGYDRDEVDDLLERAAITIESLTQKLQDVASRPVPTAASAPAEVPLPSSREDADMLQRTLLLAQRAADDAVNEAQARARQLLEESEAKAQSLVSDAEATARRIAEGERRRLEAEILDLSARREQLRADADALDAYASGYRDRIRAAIESDLEKLSGEIEAPGELPELHEVELPPERDSAPVAAVPDASEEPERESAEAAMLDVVEDQSTWEPGADTRAIGTVEPSTSGAGAPGASLASEASAAPSPVAAPPRPMPTSAPSPSPASAPAAGEWPPPAPSPEASAAPAPAPESPWLSSDDDWAPGGQSWDAPAPWERETANHEPFATDVPMEANTVDTDSLDDDAFFASLREAVRDDAPLGPRDEDQTAFFEGSSEQDHRRFRRRR
jgi:DivIVA domain-containing protein